MAVYKEEKGTWRVIYRYTDWTGEKKQTSKRGFYTKREAQSWEREQHQKVTSNLDMTFVSFAEHYKEDKQNRLKENTWRTKEYVLRDKFIPYFGNKRMSEITPKNIMIWQNQMIAYRNDKGKPYSPVYLRSLNKQLAAIFNHAVKFYGLQKSPLIIMVPLSRPLLENLS